MKKEIIEKERYHPYDLNDIILLFTDDNYKDITETIKLFTFLTIKHQVKVKLIDGLSSAKKSIESYLLSGTNANPLDSYDGLIIRDEVLEFTINNNGVFLGEKKLLNFSI